MADPLKLLLVDDTEVDRMAVRRALMRAHLDAEIQEACDVRSALDLLGKKQFDCAIIDYHLPDGDGLEILQGPGRQDGGLPPIIILTGHGSETLAVDFMKAGASDYLPKAELTPGRIEQSVRNAIRVHQAERLAQASREQLQASEKRFRDLFENSPDAVFVEDLEGEVLDVNPAACVLHGLSREALVGRRVEDLVPARHRGTVKEGFAEFVRGERTQAEGYSLGVDGREVPVEVRCRRIEFSDQPALLLHVRDITELKEARDRLEQRVAERTAELSEANVALEKEAAERREAERRERELYEQLTHAARLSSMGEMAAGLAHEINQPLGAISNYMQGCIRLVDAGDTDREALRDAMARAADQAQRAGKIIDRLRQFVSKGTPQKEVTDLGVLAREVGELLAVEARQNQVNLVYQMPAELPPVLADPIQIQQVILNLMRNAIDAMKAIHPGERRLVVEASIAGGGMLELAVVDVGPGCSLETLEHLFESFYTTKSDGMGMGLSISRSIIEAHGGQLWAEPNPDRGMSFQFTLPIANEAQHEQGEQVQ